jgi:hypothetical protein
VEIQEKITHDYGRSEVRIRQNKDETEQKEKVAGLKLSPNSRQAKIIKLGDRYLFSCRFLYPLLLNESG